jgi:multiple sugar transport system substrate-binding protein
MTIQSRRHAVTKARFSRRTAVRTGAALAAGGTLSRSGMWAAAQDAGSAITIPEAQTELPTGNVTFRWVDSGDVKGFFWREFFPKYQEAHPNITMEYQGLPWNEIQQVVPLGVRNGNAPDVFQIPLNIPAAQAANEGWGAALNDIIPDFEAYKARFPDGTFVPGITDFNGKTYTVPLTSNRRHGSLLLYNPAYLDAAGLDPSSNPFTFEEFRQAARTLTEQGAGEYYGLILEGNQVNRFANFINTMARGAGLYFGTLPGDAPIDWHTGEFLFTSDEHLAAIELLLALRDDESVFPGSMSLNAPEARARVPQGDAAMIIQGPWNISQWRKENPDFDFGVAQPPVASAEIEGFFHVGPGGDNQVWVYANSELKEVAADILMYMGTLEGQTAWSEIVGVADIALFPEAQQAEGDDVQSNQALEIFSNTIRLAPDPRVGNPDTAVVYQNIVPVQPDFGTTIQGIYTGQLENPQQAMQDLQDAWNAELERAIEAAQGDGADVSREDFVFPNWDPSIDYTVENYDGL